MRYAAAHACCVDSDAGIFALMTGHQKAPELVPMIDRMWRPPYSRGARHIEVESGENVAVQGVRREEAWRTATHERTLDMGFVGEFAC